MGGFKEYLPDKEDFRPNRRNPYPRPDGDRKKLRFAQEKMGVMDFEAPTERSAGYGMDTACGANHGPIAERTATAPSSAMHTPGWVSGKGMKKPTTQVEMQPGIERVR